MKKLFQIQAGDTVEVIAPASRCSLQQLSGLCELLTSWQLKVIVDDNLFGDDLLCSNSDSQRFALLKRALSRPETKALICARGGYGSMRLIPNLMSIVPPVPKLLLGMSDITALHLFVQQKWGWPTLHASLSSHVSQDSIQVTKAVVFGSIPEVVFIGTPLNSAAAQSGVIETSVIGGNLSIIQTSIGTSWQMEGAQKIVFLEEIGERGYRVDRMLEHLSQTGLLSDVAAIIFGDFLGGNEPNETNIIMPVLKRFAEQSNVPMIHIVGIGHGETNFPLPMGVKATLILGDEVKLRVG